MTQLDWLLLYKKLNARKFKGNLDLFNIEVPSWFRIPNNLEIEGFVDLSYTNISKLPENLKCGILYIIGCKKITELPNNLNVDILSIIGSGITVKYCKQLKRIHKIYYKKLH